MCGIAGWVRYDRDDGTDLIQAMTATMSDRGPDGHGVWLGRHAALGHHRLAVLDPPGGAQPYVVETPHGTAAITYSGETYNFAELRAELRALGHRFTTSCDTEVVLRGYLEWGGGVADRLNGMYAFAIWDARDDRLVLVRDRLGIKPLYYATVPGGVMFGSEAKAIFASGLIRPVVGLDGLRELVAHSLCLDQPVWSGVRHVRPGSVVEVTRAGPRERIYWRLTPDKHADSLPATVGQVRELLTDSVHRQLVADVPVGLLLSGGLDSSGLAALAAAKLSEQGEPVRTFAVDFPGYLDTFAPDAERPTADAPYVRTVAAYVGSAHTDVLLDPDAVADPAVRAAVVAAFDLPPHSQDRDRSMYLLFRAMRRHSTVALSGETADELFAGYHWFHDPAVRASGRFPWIAGLSGYGMLREVLRPEIVAALDVETYLADLYATAAAEVEFLAAEDARERRLRVACHLHLTRMLRVLLERKDRLSMASGLEIRVPYCDHRLVEYVYNVPWALKTFDGREKSLLRAAVEDLLPRSVAWRPKSAYPSVHDAAAGAVLQRQAAGLPATHRVFDLVDPAWLAGAVRADPARLPKPARNGLEETLNLAVWLDLYNPGLRL